MNVPYPNFLTDPQEYQAAQALWQKRWNNLIEHRGEANLWKSPWLGTTFADGTPMLDGNPIFSAYSLARRRGIRIIQFELVNDPKEMSVWIDKFAPNEPEEVSELVIACVLSDETLHTAINLMDQWITLGEVRLVRSDYRQVIPSPSREARRQQLEMTADAA